MQKIIDVPFYPQKWNHEKWQDNGFDNTNESKHWEPRSCGILSLKMAMDGLAMIHSRPLSASIGELIKQGVTQGAYTPGPGWIHKGLADLAKEYGYRAQNRGGITAKQLQVMIESDHLPIISIKWAFVMKKTLKERLLFWKKYGGHLALVVGVKTTGDNIDGLYVHHTSTTEGYNWVAKFIDLKTFEKAFTGRCIEISI